MADVSSTRDQDNGAGSNGNLHIAADDGPITPRPAPLTLRRRIDETPDVLAEEPDLYVILGVDPRSSDEIIRYAYRRKAARLHERGWRPGQAARQLAQLNAAYEILGKPDRRADYDLRRARRESLVWNGADGVQAMPSSQHRQHRRLRLPGGGLIEALVIVLVIGLAGYVAWNVLSSRSLVDLSRITELGESFGIGSRRARQSSPTPDATPASSLPTAIVASASTEPTSVPTAEPTSAPAPTPDSVAATKPSVASFSGSTVSLSDPAPPRRTNVTITALVLCDGKPVPGALVHSIIHYKTVDERWPAGDVTQSTDANGTSEIIFNVGDATPGHPVVVDVIALVEGQQVPLQTTFTPR